MKNYIILLSSLTLSGCQVINLVSVKQVDLSKNLTNERASILTDNTLSHASQNTLTMVNPKVKTCINTPDECMQSFKQIPELGDEQILSAGSELYLSHALQLKTKNECQQKFYQSEKDKIQQQQKQEQYNQCSTQYLEALNQSIRYSYAYLFATQRKPEQRLFNNRQIQVKDFYNQAVSLLITEFNQHYKNIDYLKWINIGNSQYKINATQYQGLDLAQINQLTSTYNLKFTGLNSLSRRDGFGSEFVIQLKQPEYAHISRTVNYGTQTINIFQHPNIHLGEYLPATAIIEPTQHNNIYDILTSKQFELRLINPNQHNQINIHQQSFQLAANFSAPYGLWLANSKMGSVGLNTLIDQNKGFISPQLFMLEPYNPNKKIIIMIHGLASSPEAWIATSNDIMSDPVLRENYQIWQIFYSTNIPILENRYQIYHLLNQTLQTLNKKYPQNPTNDIVLIGHSMGGVISRLLVSQDNFSESSKQYIKKRCSVCRNKNFKLDELVQQGEAYLKMHAVPNVSRTVLISAPLQGTSFADRWFTKTARKIIKLPINIIDNSVERIGYLFTNKDDKIAFEQLHEQIFQNGASDLSPHSFFMQLTANAKIIPDIKYHSIMGNNTKSTDPKIMTDGIVPYSSSHLAGATSEKIINGGHSIQETPEAVLELRRILHLHLKEIK